MNVLALLFTFIRCSSFAYIAFQDFFYRQFSIIPILVVLFCDIITYYFVRLWVFNTTVFLQNVLLIGIVILFASLYVLFRFKFSFSSLRNAFGFGDFLVLVIMAAYFASPNFILFYLAAAIISLLLHPLFNRQHQYNNHNSIPLAGNLAALYVTVVLIGYIVPDFNPINDNWFYKLVLNE
jgi:hypothetical protein